MKFRFRKDKWYYVLQYKKHWYNIWNDAHDCSVMHFPITFDNKQECIDYYNKYLIKYEKA